MDYGTVNKIQYMDKSGLHHMYALHHSSKRQGENTVDCYHSNHMNITNMSIKDLLLIALLTYLGR